MVREGNNIVRGVPVSVRLCTGHRRIFARVMPDGSIRLSVPRCRANMETATNYLNLCWEELLKKRAQVHKRLAEDAQHVVVVAAVAAGSGFCTECATVNVWHEGDRTICEASDSAWYLLDRIPLGSGDVSRPNERTWRAFSDTVSRSNNLSMVAWTMEREGADAIGITESKWDKTDVVPYALRRYVLHTNAELKYGPEDRPGQPVPGHKCIGARERRVFR